MPLPTPFPIASGRYDTGPGMRRFGQAGQGFPAESGHFQPDDLLGPTLAAKLAALQQDPLDSHLVAPGLTSNEAAGLAAALREGLRVLAAEYPAMATVQGDGVTLHHLGVRLTDWETPAPGLEPVGEG